MALHYDTLTAETEKKIQEDRKQNKQNPYRFRDENALRRQQRDTDNPNLWRPVFIRDIEKIMHLPTYNRFSDKTQVFSFYNNDDISRRALHVQLVSRIARNIGSVLGLNLDLIEAVALGHDLGHTPFGHAGERFLSDLLQEHTGRFFNHNVHSVRVLDKLYARNLTLQSLDGILCHNGEFEMKEYRPAALESFSELDAVIEDCYQQGEAAIKKLVPSTLEGCLVRVCDMIAYLGKDRQDAEIAKIIPDETCFSDLKIGTVNAELINNLTVDIIEHSYGKEYIRLSDGAYQDLKKAKDENFSKIYKDKAINKKYDEIILPMMAELYEHLLGDIMSENKKSPVYLHHIDHILMRQRHYSAEDYLQEEPNQIVTDYIASMTDDYFIDLYSLLFPRSVHKITYESYFVGLEIQQETD